MKNTLVHVGFTKAASTFLQSKVFNKLADTSSVLPPVSYWDKFFQDLLYADDSLRITESYLSDSKSPDHPNMVISNEAFCGIYTQSGVNRSKVADRLKENFPNAKILVVIRSQREMVRAHYSQYVMSKLTLGTRPLKDIFHYPDCTFSRRSLEGTTISRDYMSNRITINYKFFNYHEFITLYKKRFDHVKVVLFEDFVSNPQAFVNQICEFGEFELEERNFGDFGQKVNESKSLKELVIHRKLNALGRISQSNLIRGLGNLYFRYLDPLVMREVRSMDTLLSATNDIYAPNNQRVIDDFGLGLNKYPNQYSILSKTKADTI